MRRHLFGIVVALGLPLGGCAVAPSAPAAGMRDVVLHLDPAPAAYGVQALARRWRASDIHSYEVTLRVWDGASFVDLASPVVVQMANLASTATFRRLRQGRRYQATVVARGNAGGNAPDQVLNTLQPASSSFDLTAGQDVSDSYAAALQVVLDPVPFSGALIIQAVAPPAGTDAYEATLLDAATAEVVATVAYPAGQQGRFERLKTGIHYAVRLRAYSGDAALDEAEGASVVFDAAAAELEQELATAVPFGP